MKQTARSFAAFGSITVVMYSMFLTFFGAFFPYSAASGTVLFLSPLLLCGLAGLAAAGLGLAAAFMPPKKATVSRIFISAAAAIAIAIAAAVMIMSLFDALLSLIFGIPAIILAAAAVISLTPDRNKTAQAGEVKK